MGSCWSCCSRRCHKPPGEIQLDPLLWCPSPTSWEGLRNGGFSMICSFSWNSTQRGGMCSPDFRNTLSNFLDIFPQGTSAFFHSFLPPFLLLAGVSSLPPSLFLSFPRSSPYLYQLFLLCSSRIPGCPRFPALPQGSRKLGWHKSQDFWTPLIGWCLDTKWRIISVEREF